jgi:hypothetical protein
MSNEYQADAGQMSDLELDATLQAADTDLASALESVTDTAEWFGSALMASLEEPHAPLNDQDLDAILQAADTDLASALESVTDTAASSRIIVDEAIAKAKRTHPSYLGLANGE